MKSTVNVVCAVFLENDKVLLAQRSSGEFKDLWEFPGGKIENGETPQEALKREIMEELELDIIVQDHFLDIEYDYPNFHLHMKSYVCSFNSNNTIKLNVHKQMIWMPLSTPTNNIKLISGDIAIFNKLKRCISH